MKTITRRTALAAPVTLPLLPVSAFATPGNATDAAWSAYETARKNMPDDQAYSAFEATLPISQSPAAVDFNDHDEWWAAFQQWKQERAELPKNPSDLDDDQLDALLRPLHAAEDAIRTTPAVTFIDIERKLAVISNWGRDRMIEADVVDGILADVRALNGKGMS